ncbi:MAG TPA: hypothetical protein VEV21_15395 [Burkholderiales bacterium]|nr:hypothetical protein [Burkholderiales bacterium]
MTDYAHSVVWSALTALLVLACLFFLYCFISPRSPQREFLRIFADKQFRDRHPVRFILSWAVVVCVWLGCTALLYSLAETTAH